MTTDSNRKSIYFNLWLQYIRANQFNYSITPPESNFYDWFRNHYLEYNDVKDIFTK